MSSTDRQIWDQMLAHLRAHHPAVCRQWFEELTPLGIAGGAMQLRTLTVVHRDYLRKQCADPFSDAARTVTGRLISVRFLGPEDPATPTPAEAKAAKPPAPNRIIEAKPLVEPTANPTPDPTADPAPEFADPADAESQRPTRARQEPPPARDPFVPPTAPAPRHSLVITPDSPRYESLTINPDYSFENFIIGQGNRLAHAAALAVSTNPGRAYNPFFIHGGVGLGKTHLLQSVCLKIAEQYPSAVMYYTSCDAFVTQFIESVQSGEMSEFRHRFRDVDVLVIDDIHFLAKRDRTQEEFFHTFNSLYQASKQIILSSDAPPEDIPDLEDRLVSRFKWGLVAKIEPPGYETRVAILKTKARIRGLVLPDAVAELIASRIDTNIRELEGVIVKLHIMAAVEHRPIDLDLCRSALGDPGREVVAEPTIQSVIEVVNEFYRIRLTDLQSKHRQRSITLPRQVCMYLLRRLTRHSLTEIGGYFGGRDHTTVMHAIKTVETRRDADTEFALVLKTLDDRIRAPRPPH
ncbi:MAG: chromosomal replication initiator protein DnaA [Phycisphaerales bacterium]